MDMKELEDNSVHLMVTSPPYFNAKMYTKKPVKEDLGNVHDLDEWFEKICKVWKEVFRVLQPGRKAFINIMNLPVRNGKGFNKYGHLTKKQKENSKLDKDFWLSIKNTDVWKMKPENSGDSRSHVAPFPYQLPYRIIKAFTYVSETVLDPFLGSGTTSKAAADLKRNSVGYEIIPEISNSAVNNLRNYQNRLFV